MTTTETSTPLLDKFEALSDALNDDLLERDREIHGILVAILAAQHIFLLGSPGIGKSYLFDRLLARITGAKTYKILLRRLTMPDEVMGPIDVPALQHSRWTRASAGFLPDAHLAMIDECWKGSSAILNGLLNILNERQWHDDGQIKPVPLSSMFCASNEEPQEEGLTALYDRIMLRYEVKPVQDTSNFIEMLKRGAPAESGPILTWSEIETAKAEVATIPIGDNVYDKMAELKIALREQGIEPTDRRLVHLLKVLKAEAWLDGAEMVAPSHLSIAAHCLWESPTQQPDVETIVLNLANPLERQANKLLADIEDIAALVDAAVKAQLTEDDAHHRGMEIFNKVKSASREFDEIEAQSGGGRRLAQVMSRASQRLHVICMSMVTDVFMLPEADAAKMIERAMPGKGKK